MIIDNMQEQEDIQFDAMPNFGSMFGQQVQPQWEEKEYDSLYDELVEKLHPNNWLGVHFNKELFDTANQLYGELVGKEDIGDEELIDLRDKAIRKLGIRISTKRLYEKLDQYLNPKVYTDMKPYNGDRVAEASEYYSRLTQSKHDIIALEQLEKDAQSFIIRRMEEEEQAKQAKIEQARIIQEHNAEMKKIHEGEEQSKTTVISIAIAAIIFTMMLIISSI